MNIEVSKVVVILTATMDQVVLTLNAPTSMPGVQDTTAALVFTAKDYGAEWVRNTFGREPDDITSTRWNG